ncbi:MAG TPA: immunoglobulin domain-containing protein, partial [Clostridia bacterium]|nr:immunoglobulin domain-containing protein [Clostridia bacterium]
PGELLEVQGNGVFTTTIAGSGVGAVLIKSSNWGTTSFKRLVMAGGQIMNFINSGGNAVIAGRVEIIANTPIFSPDDTSARSIRIDAHLTGTGNIEYRAYPGTAFVPTRISSLNIAGTSNTYSGTWNVMMGTLVGSAPNALGTNTIVVGVNGALQVNYDLHNTNSDLVLDGRFNMTGNHTFRSVLINGTGLEPGLYEFTQLTNLYAANFPATWVGQPGADSLTNGSGSIRVLSGTAPVITAQPQSATRFAGQSASLSVTAVGEQPLNYQWKRWNGSAYANVANSATISGAQTATLTFSPLTIADSGDYVVEIVNTVGAKTSNPATVTVTPTGDPLVITMSALQTNPQDWETASFWSDNQPASVSAVSNPGSTYRILPGGGMRTPSTASQATFPGEVLHVEGDGVYSPAISTIGAIMLKGANPSTVSFKRLVMEGGEILNFINNSGNGIINGGELNVVANTPITAANASSGGSVRIDSQLTGNGNIEYRGYASSQYQPTWTSSLNITGTTNTYSGTWNVLIGTLVGSAPGALGTNCITVGAMGALQTTYDLLCPHATLTVDGRVHLDHNYHFGRVFVGGAELAPGYYSFQALNNSYPDYFPATWTGQMGVEAYTTGAGGLTVGDVPMDVNIEFGITGSGLELKWSQGSLLEATELKGPWTTNTTAVSPMVITPEGPQKFYRILVR